MTTKTRTFGRIYGGATLRTKKVALQDALLKALRAKYPNDFSHPGLVTSFLGGRYYASIRRYWADQTVAGSVLEKAYGPTLTEAIHAVASAWFAKNTPLSVPDAMATLKAALK